MHWTRLAVSGLLATLLACNPRGGADDGGLRGDASPLGDAGAVDAGPPGDGGPLADGGPEGDATVLTADPPPDAFAGPLFSTDGPPAEAAAAALVELWLQRPSDEAEAQAQAQGERAAIEALIAAGAGGADTLAERCSAQPPEAYRDHQHCARLLTLIESPASLAYLDGLARAPNRPRPPGPDPHRLDPAATNRGVASWALERRAAAGSEQALAVLLQQVRAPERPAIRRAAVHSLLRARPRHRIKPRLRALLPTTDHWMLYEVRR